MKEFEVETCRFEASLKRYASTWSQKWKSVQGLNRQFSKGPRVQGSKGPGAEGSKGSKCPRDLGHGSPSGIVQESRCAGSKGPRVQGFTSIFWGNIHCSAAE